ncbi:MAG: peptidoglycan editing factor PgeF [Bacteroidetes bacterium]|nr:peptidoglycan editing factor PgeF [Bacteroidota bacterium]
MSTNLISRTYIPAIFQTIPSLKAGQSTRWGGVSPAPFASFNMGLSTGDNPENVLENRRRFCEDLGFSLDQLALSSQVHGAEIWTTTAPGLNKGFDAIVTDASGVLISVSIADCTPILIADPRTRALAAVHAGWRGTAAKLVEKTLHQMQILFGTKPEDCLAYIGACIAYDAFEVGPEVAELFDSSFKRFDAHRDRFFVDLKVANRAQLTDHGVKLENIETSPYCTVLHGTDYFSYRAELGQTGRMLCAIGWEK